MRANLVVGEEVYLHLFLTSGINIYIHTHTHMYMEINGHFHNSGRFTSEEKNQVYQNNILYCTKTCFMFDVILKRNGLLFIA